MERKRVRTPCSDLHILDLFALHVLVITFFLPLSFDRCGLSVSFLIGSILKVSTCHNTSDHPGSDSPSNSLPKSCLQSSEPPSSSPQNSSPPSNDLPGSGSSKSDSTVNSPITVQESPQSVGMELASIASDSHLVLDRYWRDSFNSSSSSSSNTTISESGMP